METQPGNEIKPLPVRASFAEIVGEDSYDQVFDFDVEFWVNIF